MQHLVRSIEIKRPPHVVFAFLRDMESRVRLNPSYTVFGFEALTHKEMRVGARYRFLLKSNGKWTRHECEIVEMEENKKIVTRALDRGVRLTLTLKETAIGTVLTHQEQFTLREEMIEKSLQPSLSQFILELWRKEQHISGPGSYDPGTQRRINEIMASLRNGLRAWLERIKEKLEAG